MKTQLLRICLRYFRLVLFTSTVVMLALLMWTSVYYSRRRHQASGEENQSRELRNAKVEADFRSAALPLCSSLTKKLEKETAPVKTEAVSYLELRRILDTPSSNSSSSSSSSSSQLQRGGSYKPADCERGERTAIIIPYRDRRRQLLTLLRNLIPFLMRQKIWFTIFVVEQTSEFPFNRCLLFNVGYVESFRKSVEGNYSCFIVHDTDLVPRYYGNLYRCHRQRPRHFVVHRSNNDKPGLPYSTYIGGVLGVRRHNMEAVNGCSNLYYNWGREDDDLYNRFRHVRQMPVRYANATVGEYVALEHALQPRNTHRETLFKTFKRRMEDDGLSSLSYTLEDFEERELYTWMLVRIPPPPSTLYPEWNKKTKH